MPDLISWGAHEIAKLKGDLDKLFDDLFEDFALSRAVCPDEGISLAQAGDGWIVTCPLPGFEPGEVSVTVAGRVLLITAARKEAEGVGLVTLSRRLSLPFPVEAAEAEFSGGTLTVSIRRSPPSAVRSVPVVKR
ncbi:Hsp20/alpha crystallin family protein [Fundidesulfovibrio terrae]|uniref:Hsp20/alpha crystallin family protein n=1 Tax=Fundidesulfovibrio terrae TaxID=2922866 RepID=UPI001FAEE751|nr:Hsp20 family protein [Fundidesulfovibrio terrae]